MYCNVVCKFAAHSNGKFEPKRKISKSQWKSRVFLKLNLIVRTYLLSCSSMKLDKWKSWLNIYKKLKNHLYLHAQNMFSYFSQESFLWNDGKKYLSFVSYVLMKSVFTVHNLPDFLTNYWYFLRAEFSFGSHQ
jgi:hypothetical protein